MILNILKEDYRLIAFALISFYSIEASALGQLTETKAPDSFRPGHIQVQVGGFWGTSGKTQAINIRQNLIGEAIPFDDKSFDYIYLISVFTHLTLEEQKRLVEEFRRLLRPGGYVYVSFHGEYFYPTMFARLDDAEKIFERDGFLIEKQQLEGSNDCFTLHSPESLVRLFAGFELLKHYRSTERGPTDAAAWQDSMIFELCAQS